MPHGAHVAILLPTAKKEPIMTISTTDTDVLSALSNQMADAVARVRPALVLVNGRQRQPASGIVFAHEHVLTADHVIDREEDLSIETDAIWRC
jgi:hypothetical protein